MFPPTPVEHVSLLIDQLTLAVKAAEAASLAAINGTFTL